MTTDFKLHHYFVVNDIFIESAFDNFLEQPVYFDFVPTVLFYWDYLSDEKKKVVTDRVLASLDGRLYQIQRDFQYPHVQDWVAQNENVINDFFNKSLKRKRSMDGELSVISRWMAVWPQGKEWQSHLNSELKTWVNIPKKGCDFDDIYAVLQYIGKDHPKYTLLLTYAFKESMNFSIDNRHMLFNENFGIILKDNDTLNNKSRILDVLNQNMSTVAELWPIIPDNWMPLLLHRLLCDSDLYKENPDLKKTVKELLMMPYHHELIQKQIIASTNGLSFMDKNDILDIYDFYFLNEMDKLGQTEFHLLYKYTRSPTEKNMITFVMDIMKNDIFANQEDPHIAWRMECLYHYLQQNIGWVSFLILAVLRRNNARWIYRESKVEISELPFDLFQQKLIEAVFNLYPQIKHTLETHCTKKDRNIMLNILNTLSFSSKEEVASALLTMEVTNDHPFFFEKDLANKLGFTLAYDKDKGFYLHCTSNFYESSFDDDMVDMVKNFVNKTQLTVSNNMEEYDLF